MHHTADPVWNWSFSLALQADIGELGAREGALHLTVCDAKTLGDPAVLGRCVVGGQGAWVGAGA